MYHNLNLDIMYVYWIDNFKKAGLSNANKNPVLL